MIAHTIKPLFLTLLFSALSFGIFAQQKALKPNWQNLDLTSDTTFGISTEKAYTELLSKKKSINVIVAVIDGGTDVTHEDLKKVIYSNPKEKKNGKDDDKNGYKDDVNGWNFLGSEKGNIDAETLELTRLVKMNAEKFKNVTNVDSVAMTNKVDFNKHLEMKSELSKKLAEAQNNLNGITGFKTVLEAMVTKMGKSNPTLADFEAFIPKESGEAQIKKVLLKVMADDGVDYLTFKNNEIDKTFDHFYAQVNYHLNLDYNPRTIVGDDENNMTEKFYGNSDVKGPDALHGTHVAGIIAAQRNNKLGIDGVANNVSILVVRAVPNGDERDKDVANAIIYAVNNGAKIINMSFGKSYSPNKAAVDAAVKYAVSKDVLLVHSAGNENKNNDQNPTYPNKEYEDKTGYATSWIEVGASGPHNNETLKADFSNYGKTTVDVFAPGVAINSTTPNSTYTPESGTSMAAPVVSGLAALIRSYYPKLTAVQVKQIIMNSSIKVKHNVSMMVDKKIKTVPFSDLSISGGVINAYEALKLAENVSSSLSAK